MKKSLFNYHILNFFFSVNVSSLADPPRAKLSIGCLFAHPGQISRCTARSTHVRRFDSSKSSGGTRTAVVSLCSKEAPLKNKLDYVVFVQNNYNTNMVYIRFISRKVVAYM